MDYITVKASSLQEAMQEVSKLFNVHLDTIKDVSSLSGRDVVKFIESRVKHTGEDLTTVEICTLAEPALDTRKRLKFSLEKIKQVGPTKYTKIYLAVTEESFNNNDVDNFEIVATGDTEHTCLKKAREWMLKDGAKPNLVITHIKIPSNNTTSKLLKYNPVKESPGVYLAYKIHQ